MKNTLVIFTKIIMLNRTVNRSLNAFSDDESFPDILSKVSNYRPVL